VSVLIRPAVDSDSAALVRVLSPEVDTHVITNRFAELHAGLRLLLVLETDSTIAGTISISTSSDEDGVTRRLFALDVGAGYRRLGFATALIKEVESRVLSDGHTALRLEVSVDNRIANALYEKLGYRRAGVPEKLRWSQPIDGQPSVIVTETSQRMIKSLA
jgi:ribosomal protein S18 acetylase RimI-like enzyme